MRREWLRKVMLAVALCALVVLTVACGSAASANDPGGGAEIQLEKQDAGRRIELDPGQTFVIALESNPSTGYSWQMSAGDEAIVKQVGEAQFVDQAGQNVVGAAGQEVLRFEAQQKGTTTLELVYHRPWEKDVEPLERFTVEVVVE